MSNPILPLLEWPPGIQQASVPANDNALRNEALSMPVLGVANDESSPSDGDIWIVGDTPAGAFLSFEEHDIALYRGGWHAWAPIEGVRLVVADVRKMFDGAEWIDDPAGGGIPDAPIDGTGYVRKDGAWAAESGGGPTAYTIVTEASASTATVGTNDGLFRYNRCGGDVTFDSAQPYTAGMAFNIRATAAIELLEDGVTLTPPAGGTLDLESGMAVQVVMTGAATADVIGQTVPGS